MKHLIFYFLLILCLLQGNLMPVSAQDLTFGHLTDADGLSHYTVLSIYQDERGLMWFGTENGINLYNGKSIKVYKNGSDSFNSLRNNHIKQIVGDKEGHLYISTLSGVQAYSIKDESFTTLFSKQASCIYYGEGLYMAYQHQLFKYNGTKFELYFQFPDNECRISRIYVYNDSIALGTTDKGVFFLHRKELSHPIPQGFVTDIFRDSSGSYWVSNNMDGVGLYRITQGNVQNFRSEENNPNSLTSNYTHRICEDKRGNIWIGTLNGLTEYDRKTNRFIRHPQKEYDRSLSHSSIWGLYCDDQGTIWAGTYFGGVNYFNPEKQPYNEYIPSMKEGDGLSSGIISQMTEDDEGNLWIGTEGGGLNKYDRKTKRFEWFKHNERHNSLSHNNVKSVYYDSLRHTLWIGTHLGGLNRYDLRTGRFTNYLHDENNPASIPSNIVSGIVPYKDRLLLATYNGIGVFDIQTGQCRYLIQDKDDFSETRSTLGLLIDYEGVLWITNNSNGACSYDFDTRELKIYKKNRALEHSLSSNYINSIYEDSRHRLWFCTNESGLDFYDRKTGEFKNYNAQDNGLAGNQVFNICEIAPDRLLATTDQGISVLDYSTGKFSNYTNLPLLSLKENALYRTKNGEVFVGGVAGMISFTQESVKAFKRTYRLFPSRLTVNGKEISVGDESGILSQSLSLTQEITLQPDQNVFNIEYAMTDYIPFNEDALYYRLEGFSEEWIPLNEQNVVTYTNLAPGTYTLSVKAVDKAKETVAESLLRIKVLPPFYRTIGAYLFYLLCASGIVYYLIRNYKRHVKLQESLKYEHKHTEDIEKLNQAKLRFFTNISHEFRTPLTLIIGQMEILLQVRSLAPAVYNKILGMYKNCLQLKELINELLDFRKQEQGYMTIKVSEHNVVDFLYEYYLLFQEYARQRKITLDFLKSSDDIPLWFDAKQMQKVINNLLSNAFKHTREGGRIFMSVKKRNQEVLIEVTDNGTGIASKDIDKIFDRFYQTDLLDSLSTNPGSGIGLALTKGIIDLHHGKIEVFSEPGEGSTFCIHLKCGNEHFTAEQIAEKRTDSAELVKDEVLPQPLEETNMPEEGNAPQAAGRKMLIVEDNDSLREMLVDVFKDFYDVETASDGVEGWEKIQAEQPDIVLSDVIMPRMSGTELCRNIKTNMETCHIPVVLLTARTAVEHTIEGLRLGADDYITKPFNVNILLARCNNLVNNRILLQEKYSKQPQATPYILATNEMDKKFVDQVVAVIERHLDNSEFKVDMLVEELCIPRNKLFTKIKAITGQTPNAFIMTYRLKRAAVMLKNYSETNISEIAYQLGFNDPKYFTKCFKEKYAMAPQEYRKQKTTDGL